MKSLAEAIEANRARQAAKREQRARSFTVTSEPGYTYVGPCGAVVLAQFLGTTPEPCDCFRTGVCPTLEGVTP